MNREDNNKLKIKSGTIISIIITIVIVFVTCFSAYYFGKIDTKYTIIVYLGVATVGLSLASLFWGKRHTILIPTFLLLVHELIGFYHLFFGNEVIELSSGIIIWGISVIILAVIWVISITMYAKIYYPKLNK